MSQWNEPEGTEINRRASPDCELEGGTAVDERWVEGPGWRMKAPAEKKRQEVVRGLEAAKRIERERQERKASRGYTTPSQGQAMATDGAQGAAAPEPPLTVEALRMARVRKATREKMERKQAREEVERRAKEYTDATIQRKLDRARRAQEKLEAKERGRHTQRQQTVRSSWQQRPLGNNGGPDFSVDTSTGDLESRQIQTAINNSLADQEKARGVAPSPPAHPPEAAPACGTGNPCGPPAPDGIHEAKRSPYTPEYWDPILDGPFPVGPTDRVEHDGSDSRDWGAVLAEALSVVECDVSDEIPSAANRHGFRRLFVSQLRNILRGDDRGARVLNDDPNFREHVGRWACGRRLMRLAGFDLERGASQEYWWVARSSREKGRLAMLEELVRALEDQSMKASSMGGGGGGGAGGSRASMPPHQHPDKDEDLLARTTSYAFAAGLRATPPLRLSPAAAVLDDEFARTRKEQDEAFKEALLRDRASSGKTRAPARAENQQEESPPSEPNIGEGAGGVGGTGGGEDEDGSSTPTPREETAEERRAKFAESFSFLGLGS